MTAILEGLRLAALFLAGLIVRGAVLVLVVTAIAAPILLALAIWKRLPAVHRRLRGVRRVAGPAWRGRPAHAPGHLWLQRLRSGEVRVGLDGLAASLLQPLDAVGLPCPGQELEAGRAAVAIRCGHAELRLAAPLAGRVTAANERLAAHPRLAGSDPYLAGWLFRIRPADSGPEPLPRGRASRAWFEREAVSLARLVEQEEGHAAADGGELVGRTAPLSERPAWPKAVARFLRPLER
jgi:glycine cleavage system H protein